MRQTFKPAQEKWPESPATGLCPQRARQPKLAPPGCCPPPRDSTRRSLIERRAKMAEDAAGSDRRAAARVRAERDKQLLAADIALDERRALTLECGIDCLQADIDNARAIAARGAEPLGRARQAAASSRRSVQVVSRAAAETVVLHVGGLHYATEKALVERALRARPGVVAVEANPVAQTATVTFDPVQTSLEQLRAWVEQCGWSRRDLDGGDGARHAQSLPRRARLHDPDRPVVDGRRRAPR